MFVYIVLGRRFGGDNYIVGVYGKQAHADTQADRWKRQHPTGHVEVQKFTVINGQP